MVGEAVFEVEDVGDQPGPGVGGELQPRGEDGGCELGDRWGAFAAEVDGAFAAGELGLDRVDGAGAVLSGELRDQQQDLHPGLATVLVQGVDPLEEVTLGELCPV